MTTITIAGQTEEDFRREVESDLRHGREAQAAERLRTLLKAYAGENAALPARFLTVTADDLSLRGWDYLGDCIARHDRPGRPVTALSIAFGWAGEEPPAIDEAGCLHPHIETGYFNDAAYPFSQSGRDDLLDGYSLHGCTWAADCEASDNALSVDGIDDLYGALARLEERLLASDSPDEEEIRAGSLGSCLLSVLLFQAVSTKIKADGLPRPLCVTAGSNGVYPYFDAPVVGMPESARRAAAQAEEEEDEVAAAVPGPRYSSLLMTGIPRAQKRAVLVLAETEQEMAVRIARLRGHGESGADAAQEDALSEDSITESHADAPVTPPISAAAEGILAVKKPSGHNWDFRDMLGPPPTDDAPGQPEFEPEPEPDPGLEPELLPRAELPDPPVDREEDGPLAAEPVEPGFALLSESLQDRLESLLSPQVPITVAEPAAPAAQPRVHAQPWPAEQAGAIWPFGPTWDDEPPAQPLVGPETLANPANVPNVGLWARLSAWIRPRR